MRVAIIARWWGSYRAVVVHTPTAARRVESEMKLQVSDRARLRAVSRRTNRERSSRSALANGRKCFTPGHGPVHTNRRTDVHVRYGGSLCRGSFATLRPLRYLAHTHVVPPTKHIADDDDALYRRRPRLCSPFLRIFTRFLPDSLLWYTTLIGTKCMHLYVQWPKLYLKLVQSSTNRACNLQYAYLRTI